MRPNLSGLTLSADTAPHLVQILGLTVLIGGARLVYHLAKPHKTPDDYLKIAAFSLNLGLAYFAVRELQR